MKQRKLSVGLIFGGRSAEHEASLNTAISVLTHLDREKYNIVPIGISREGSWLVGIEPSYLLAVEQNTTDKTKLIDIANSIDAHEILQSNFLQNGGNIFPGITLDVVFPALHGTNGEDGVLQGLLEMADVPYVGSGVRGSALGMDKEKTKVILNSAGLDVVDYLVYRRYQWERSPEKIMDIIEYNLEYPCFVKPANLGSSIGISKVHDRTHLKVAMYLASNYDDKIVIERSINCREVQCAVLGNIEPTSSVVGEIIVSREFYDYQAKYLENTSQIIIPAKIPQIVADEIRNQAIRAFIALDLTGFARVDFFIERESENIYVNEVNTLPSLTNKCMYSKLYAESGLSYPHLLDKLIDLAIDRYNDKSRNWVNI